MNPKPRSLPIVAIDGPAGAGKSTVARMLADKLGFVLVDWMHQWRGALEHGWPDRTAVGAFLRTIPEKDTIYCDEATVEILSGLDRKRFDRHWIDAPDGADRIEATAARDGEVYVATWAKKLKELRTRPGVAIVWRPNEDGLKDDEGLAVARVTAPR